MINLDFCIIENPLDKNKKPIIFVTRQGSQYLDETVVGEEDYEKAIYTIQNMGYVESDILTFESLQDPDFPVIAINDIKKSLEEKGMRYSQQLEEKIKEELELLNIGEAKQMVKDIAKKRSNIISPGVFSTIKKTSKYKIPEIGEKLTLYFYLFIECNFSGTKCYLKLNGDFFSNESSILKNYIFPFKCDFVRINNIYNPNKIILKSCQTNKEILKGLPLDYGGSFNLIIKEKDKILDKLFVYYLMEVKNSFAIENRITIEVDSSSNFDQMIVMSKKIKQDYEKLFKRTSYDVAHLHDSFAKIKEILIKRMWELAKEDEFEKAAKTKIDIAYTENRINVLNSIKNTSMPYFKFVKLFHLN